LNKGPSSTSARRFAMSWHSRSCDIDIFRTEDKPACRRCGRIAPAPKAVEAIPPAPPPPHTKRSELRCRWPPQVDYSDDSTEDPEFQEEIEYIRANVDDWEVGSCGQVPATEARSERTKEARSETTAVLPSAGPITRSIKDDQMEREPSLIYTDRLKSDNIRVLRLHTSQDSNGPIHCSLETIGLHDPNTPLFEALSYTWADPLTGDAKLSQPIYVGPDFDILLVTRNCAAALQQFRKYEDRLLWVDAVCINQADGQERGSQVALMRDIYSVASRVLIYLGPGDDETDIAMRHILDPALPHEPWAANTIYTNAMRRLIHQPYFTRAWVVQEVQLAHKATVTCGSYTVHWTIFCEFFKTSEARHHCAVDDSWILNDSKTLVEHMINTRNCLCGDRRDKVFSVLGLVRSSKAPNLPVDYSLSVQEVFTGLASHFIQVLKDPSFSSYACKTKQTPHLPSWVPDWSPSVGGTERLVKVEIVIPQAPSITPTIPSFPKVQRRDVPWAFGPERSIVELHALRTVEKLKISCISASLYTDAYPIFSYRGGKFAFTCFPEEPACRVLHEFIYSSISEQQAETLESLHGFFVPDLNSMLVLKKYNKRTYSICHRFTVQMRNGWNKSLSTSDPYSSSLIKGIRNAEHSILKHWMITVLYLRDREGDGTPKEVLEKGPQDVKLLESDFAGIDDHLISLLEDMRKEILDIIHLETFRQMRTRTIHIFDISNVSDNSRKLVFSVGRDDWKELNILWDRTNCSPKDQIIAWQDAVDQFKSSIGRYGSITEAFQSLLSSDLVPVWPYDSTINRGAIWNLIGLDNSRITYHNCNHYLDGPGLIYGAWSMLHKIQLDATKSWAWNRDRFWIHIATLEMLAGLHETLRHRQFLHGFRLAKEMPPKRIIIV
jgi:hypothetical protein